MPAAPETSIQHAHARMEVERELAVIRAAIDAHPPGEVIYIENAASPLYPFWGHFPGRAALFTIFFPDNVVNGRRVVFVEANRSRLRRAPRGRRTGALFVAAP